MNKAKRLKQVNALLFLFLVYQAFTGILLGIVDGEALEVLHPIGGGALVVLVVPPPQPQLGVGPLGLFSREVR